MTPALPSARPGDDTPAGLFAALLAAEPARPFLTCYDDATAERTEVSAATLANWVAKTANLVVDGLGLDARAAIGVLLPAHWQSAAVLLGIWSVGAQVVLVPPEDTGTSPAPSSAPGGLDAAFAAEPRLGQALAATTGDVVGLSLRPLAAPLGPGTPAGVVDFALEVPGYGDGFAPASAVDPRSPALAGPGPADPPYTHFDLAVRARTAASGAGLTRADRLLTTLDWDGVDALVSGLLAPLAGHASVVLVAHPDEVALPGRIAQERVTRTWP